MTTKTRSKLAELFYLWDKHYKLFLLIPLIVASISIGIILTHKIRLGKDFKGGTSYIIVSNLSYGQITKIFSKYQGVEVKYLGGHRYMIVTPYGFKFDMAKIGKVESKIEISRQLGKSFERSAEEMIIIGFILLVVSVFISFRTFVPASLMILSIIFDTLFAFALMVAKGIPLSIATISILLMLIGYSIDTDILMTSRVLKRRDLKLSDRFYHSMKTGLTMQLTALTVMAIIYILTTLFFPLLTIIKDISYIIVCGVIADIIFTWCFNASMLRIWYERYEAQGK